MVDRYEKITGSDLKVQKTHGAPGTTLSKSETEEQKKYKYRSFVGKLIW